ncbi:TPM domain-containing protein [Thiomonas sp.]|uniref:TPM domain-containing protein n=1 Tax=Thiomonas sp. TaxID=2047785 RepID=UPI0025902057|nr:TPM domain-containing protein [Thiomonas sp.]
MALQRLFRHALYPTARVHMLFPRQAMQAIANAIHAAEGRHGGEIRVAIEGALDWPELWRGVTPRQQAIALFSSLRVWDTERNDGVLIYLLLAEHAVEIVADRGIAARVAPESWQAVCRGMERHLRQSRHLDAILQGVDDVSKLLAEHAPAREGAQRNELSDWPVVVKR